MARGMLRLLLGDLRHRRLQSFLLLLVVAVATAGITAGLAQQREAGDRWDDAFARANGAHVAVFGTTASLDEVATDPEVVQSAGPSPMTAGTLRFGDASVDEVDVRGAGPDRPEVGTPLPFSGRWLAAGATDEVVVERSLALDLGISPGDQLVLEGPGASRPMRVVGVYLDLLDCFYPDCGSAAVWVPEPVIGALDPAASATQSMLLVRLSDPHAVAAFEARIQAEQGTGVSHVLDWEDTRHDTLVINQFFGAFLSAFGVFLLLAAALVIVSSVSALVLARFGELGTLKAMGFTPVSLTALVLVENLVVASVGALLGIVGGSLVAPLLQLRVAEVLERGRATFPPGIAALALAIVVVIMVVATIVPAVRSGRVPASRAIARGAGPVSTRPSHLAAIANRLRLGTSVSVGLKDTGARPLRTWMTVLTLAVTVAAIVVTLGLERTVAAVTDDPARTGDPYDLGIDPAGADPAAIESALARDDVAGWFTATDRRGAVGDQTFHVRALGGDPASWGYVVHEGRMIEAPDETIVGYGLLQMLHLHVGDRLALDVSGGTLDLRIVGWYGESEDSGRIAQISLDALRSVEPTADAGAYLVQTGPDGDPVAVRDAVLAATGGTAKVALVDRSADELDAFRIAFYVLSALVLAVGLVNLLGTTLLGIRERLRDIAVLKTIGFTPWQTAASVAVGDAAFGVAAVAIGIPVGLAASSAMLDAVGTSSGLGPGLGAAPALTGLVVTGLAIVAIGAAIGAIAARGAAGAPVAEILRSE